MTFYCPSVFLTFVLAARVRRNVCVSLGKKMAIYGTLAIRPSANNMGKWGIPEKSYENVVQRC